MDTRLILISAAIMLALLMLLNRSIQDHLYYKRGCAHEGMTLVETAAGYRCRDDRGDEFLPPFKPEMKR